MTPHFFQFGKISAAALDALDEEYSEEWFTSRLGAEEAALSQKFKHAQRRREFLAGRALLHILEPRLSSILSSKSGMPLWTQGFTGSLSHKNGWVLACVSSVEKLRSVGMDLEEPEKFPLDVARVICVPDEIEILAKSEVPRDYLSLLFSCKESLYKCCFPICQTWFGFQDAKLLSYDTTSGIFTIQLLKDLPQEFLAGQIFTGHFKWEIWKGRRFVITSLTLNP